METTEFSKFTAEISGREKIIIEFPAVDINISDVCQAFRTIMVGMTFTDESAGEMIASYLEEYYEKSFEVIRLNEEHL